MNSWTPPQRLSLWFPKIHWDGSPWYVWKRIPMPIQSPTSRFLICTRATFKYSGFSDGNGMSRNDGGWANPLSVSPGFVLVLGKGLDKRAEKVITKTIYCTNTKTLMCYQWNVFPQPNTYTVCEIPLNRFLSQRSNEGVPCRWSSLFKALSTSFPAVKYSFGKKRYRHWLTHPTVLHYSPVKTYSQC